MPAAAVLAAGPSTALADRGEGASLGAIASSWQPDGLVVGGLFVLAVLYRAGIRKLPARRRRSAAGWGGIASIALVLLTPIDELAGAIFSWHMVQHVVLLFVAAPLLAAGELPLALVALLPPRLRRSAARGWRATQSPAGVSVTWLAATATLWAWHVPALYDAALRHSAVHLLEHSSLVLVGIAAWDVIRASTPATGYPARLLFVFALMLQMAALSAALVFSPRPWYGPYASVPEGWPLGPMADQQVAGALMWAVGSLSSLGATAWLIGRWFSAEEQRASAPVPPVHASRAEW